MLGPAIHQRAPLLQQIGARIGGLGLVLDAMRQRPLHHLPPFGARLAGPIAEGGAEYCVQNLTVL